MMAIPALTSSNDATSLQSCAIKLICQGLFKMKTTALMTIICTMVMGLTGSATLQAQTTTVKSGHHMHPMLKWCPDSGISVPPSMPCPGEPDNPPGGGTTTPGTDNRDCGNDRACYSQLSADTSVYSTNKVILQQTIDVPHSGWAYFESDGRVFPSGGRASADVWISVDGLKVSNSSVVDWSKTTNGQQHGYNCIGATYLSSGKHVVKLIARSLNSRSFTFGEKSNLSALTNVAPTVKTASLNSDTATLSFNTQGLTGTSVLPTSPITTVNISNIRTSPVVALASARAYEYGHPGDPLMSITMDGATLPNDTASWSDNDLYSGAENQAPFYVQAYITNASSANHAISLSASGLPMQVARTR
jgi:hypothetical protein